MFDVCHIYRKRVVLQNSSKLPNISCYTEDLSGKSNPRLCQPRNDLTQTVYTSLHKILCVDNKHTKIIMI